MHPEFHATYLQPHLGPALCLPPAPLDDVAAGEYKVKDILDLCMSCFGPEYLVKWLGYPVLESLWELVSHQANAPNILH